MTLTLLLDLDDTLLLNNMDTFLPAYLGALSQHLSPHFPGDRMVKELLSATRRMVANQNPCITLEEAFNLAFYPALGTTADAMRATLNDFYARMFPELQKLTAPRAGAVELVKTALRRGYRVVVATNPLFPATAIHQRLAWAGLPVNENHFALVTSYEHMHFAKPNPAYYAEILARLGWPEQPAVMVGNSLSDDILPAAALGLPTYWLDASAGAPGDPNPISGRGDLSDLLAWLEQNAAQLQPPAPTTPAGLLGLLRATPAALDTITRQMPTECWQAAPAPKEWTITEIACHLRDVDREVNLPRLLKLQGEDNPFLPGIDSDPWAEQRDYCHQNGQQALDAYQQARIEILSLLDGLSAPDWQRLARHAIFGPTRLIELVEFIATHDRTHLQQVLKNLCASG